MSSQDNIIKFEEARRSVRSNRSTPTSRTKAKRPSHKSSQENVASRSSVSTPVRQVTRKSVKDSKSFRMANDSQSLRNNRQSAKNGDLDTTVRSSSSYSRRSVGTSQSDASMRSRNASYGADDLLNSQKRTSLSRDVYYENSSDYDPQFDVFGEDVPSDDYQEEDLEPRSKSELRKRKKVKLRAEKAFMKQFGSDDASPEGGTRAALYEFKMGSEHKRACAQLEGKNPSSSSNGGKSGLHAHKTIFGSTAFRVTACVVILLVGIGAFLYPAAQQYYIEMRNHDRIEAEYQAVLERNEALQEDVDHLQTDEGIQDAARTDLGWVGEGENAVVVTDLPEDTESTSGTSLHPQIPSGSIEAPETWYSKFLDPFFGYSSVAQV